MTAVLVLDDDVNVLRMISQALAAAGADVLACREIEAAEALIENRRFDAVVTDLNVSERGGMEGMRLARHLAAEWPETRTVCVTGLVDERIGQLGRAMGMRAVLQKPVDFAVLRAAVLDPSQARRAAGHVTELEPIDSVLTSGRIRSALQPICALTSRESPFQVHAVEGLARFATCTQIYDPALLFEYAVRKDRVFETDRRCIGAALNEAQFLPEGTRLFLNAHPVSLVHPGFAATALEMVEQAGFAPELVVFEVTEHHLIRDGADFARHLIGLRELGFRIALDDFGSGAANLQLLIELSPQYLKLAGSLLRGIEHDRARQVAVAATADMAERLNVPLIVENVETEAEFRAIRRLGIPYGQGYYFAQPSPARALMEDASLAFERVDDATRVRL